MPKPTPRYPFHKPVRGDVYLSDEETIFTIVDVTEETVDFNYELSYLTERNYPLAPVIGGVEVYREHWVDKLAPNMDLWLTNIGDIPFHMRGRMNAIEEVKQEASDLADVLNLRLWQCVFDSEILQYVTFIPIIGILANEGLHEYGLRMGFVSPMVDERRNQAMRMTTNYNQDLHKLIGYRLGGKTPDDIISESAGRR